MLMILFSSSKLGGVITMACFFFNHEESTRVMWTPPLRESFGYPLSLLQILCVCKALNADAISDGGTVSQKHKNNVSFFISYLFSKLYEE